MPSQLLQRLTYFYDPSRAATVAGFEDEDRTTTGRHWPVGTPQFGLPLIDGVRSIVIHETSGWTSFDSADGFVKLYTNDPQRDSTNHLGDRDGFGPQFYVDANGTAFQVIGSFEDDIRLTYHATYLNGVSIGIENGDVGDAGNVKPPQARFRAMPGNLFGDATVYLLLHPDGNADALLLWFANANYSGPHDTVPVGWNRMIFTERDYRTLALLCRFLTAAHSIPRNFPLLPYERAESNGNTTNVDRFRRILAADEHHDQFIQTLGKTTADFNTTTAALNQWYAGQAFTDGFQHPANHAWRHFLLNDLGGGYQGLLGHGFVGDHDECPGPLFDWHRFAREVWDWWWYPFDFDPLNAVPYTTFRPYLQSNKDTRLQNYYYDSDGTHDNYENLLAPTSVVDNPPVVNTFILPLGTLLYSIANGVLIAARLVAGNMVGDSGFMLTRHEVFYKTVGARIDYDKPPTYVYSLLYFSLHPSASLDTPAMQNPGWFNRFLIRWKETQLAVQLQTANLQKAAASQDNALTHGWNFVPNGGGWDQLQNGGSQRPSTGQQITTDATAYDSALQTLKSGQSVLMPLEIPNGATPVRVILGDFLGVPSMVTGGQTGLHIEIFSTESLPVTGAVQAKSPSAVQDWWKEVSAYVQLEGNPRVVIPLDGTVWQYPTLNFLDWVNDLTWTSEWDKYDVQAAGAKAPRPPKPKDHRV